MLGQEWLDSTVLAFGAAFAGASIFHLNHFSTVMGASSSEAAPKFKFDPDWPKPLPNKWKIGGIMGLAVDKDDNVWAYDRANDLTDIELEAELNPPIADCCKRPPSLIHFDKEGNVIGTIDPQQGHGLAVDLKGFLYVGNVVDGLNSVHKYDPKTGALLGTVPRAPEKVPGSAGRILTEGSTSEHVPGHGGVGPVATFVHPLGGPPQPQPDAAALAARAKAIAAFHAKYPPTTPMIVGQVEEIRIDDAARELYATDDYLGRIMVFDLDTLAFKRGWGAYGQKLSEISTDDKDRAYTPGGPEPKELIGDLTLNISHDGLVYAGDRRANRIQVFTKEGKFLKEFTVAVQYGGGRFRGRGDVLAGQGAAALVYFRYHQRPRVVPEPRRRQDPGPDGADGTKRGRILRHTHGSYGLEGRPLHGRSFCWRKSTKVPAGQVTQAQA